MTKRCSPALILFLFAFGARAADSIQQVFDCGRQGSVGGLGSGVDLTRYTVDIARFPEAVCNDGTPSIFYYAASTKPEDRNNWMIFLQGGGSCLDGQTCAQRWCSIDTNYGMDKMTTSLSKAQIRGVGFLSPDAQNGFGSWNRVLIFYCSSDAWGGTSVRTLQAALNDGTTREYQISFKGSRIIDAVLDTLRNASATPTRRRVARHSEGETADATAWPDLDEATGVIFAGSSAGGAGVRANLDRVGAKLRATNPDLDFRGLTDAIYGTLAENRNFAQSTYCATDPARGCSYETFTRATRDEVEVALFARRDDESCAQWHAAHAPGTEWRCSDGEHVNLHHIATPFFIHQDLQDSSIGGGFVEANFGTAADYATTVEQELRNLPVPEEARGAVPGLFIPQCTDHESFTDNVAVFEVKLTGGVSYHDAVWNWWMHTQPQQLIRHFTGTPGRAPECP